MADFVVVDDDPDAAEAMGEVMQSEGHAVRVAFDGREALRLVVQEPPDAVLLDVDVPLLDGPGVSFRMLVHNCGLEKIPIVLLSGVPDLIAIAATVGTPYFLPKPFSYEQLQHIVDRALTERIPPQPLVMAAHSLG